MSAQNDIHWAEIALTLKADHEKEEKRSDAKDMNLWSSRVMWKETDSIHGATRGEVRLVSISWQKQTSRSLQHMCNRLRSMRLSFHHLHPHSIPIYSQYIMTWISLNSETIYWWQNILIFPMPSINYLSLLSVLFWSALILSYLSVEVLMLVSIAVVFVISY
jgi:hypothetical protein